MIPLYDAHNHLQDERFAGAQEGLIKTATDSGVRRMVVNGSCEEDWPEVQSLARRFPAILPSFGYHPWYVKERTPTWRETLVRYLDETPSAVGEIGLDRWIPDHDTPLQEEMFVAQLRLAAERDLPVSIHCLKAWGRLEELLRKEPRPKRGFLLHSYGGPPEMILPLTRLGAFFSFPGYFLLERKLRQRETFRHVPSERLLIETDAPDQRLPETQETYPLKSSDGTSLLNHPANLGAVYRGLAEFLGRPREKLAEEVETNFHRLFGA